MKFHVQEFRHDPDNGIYGDCQRAVIASLLGLEMAEVPNFNEGGPDSYDFFDRLDTFLAKRGLGRLSIAFDGSSIDIATRHMAAHFSEGQPYMLSGKSPRGVNHVVIYRGVELLWDSHPDRSGLIGPCSDGYYWVEVLTPLLQIQQEKGYAMTNDNVMDGVEPLVPSEGLYSEAQIESRFAELMAEKDARIEELEETCSYDGEILRKIGHLLRYVDQTEYSGTYDAGVKAIIDERDQLRQQLLLAQHQYDVMKASAEVCAQQADTACQQLAEAQGTIDAATVGYEGGAFITSLESNPPKFQLYYKTDAQAERAFDAITSLIDAAIASQKRKHA